MEEVLDKMDEEISLETDESQQIDMSLDEDELADGADAEVDADAEADIEADDTADDAD